MLKFPPLTVVLFFIFIFFFMYYLLYVFRCCYVECIDIYKCYSFLVDSSHFFIMWCPPFSLDKVCLKVYCYPTFCFHLHSIYFAIPSLCEFSDRIWFSSRHSATLLIGDFCSFKAIFDNYVHSALLLIIFWLFCDYFVPFFLFSFCDLLTFFRVMFVFFSLFFFIYVLSVFCMWFICNNLHICLKLMVA